MALQEEQLVETKCHLSDLQYEFDKCRNKETKLERSLADAIAKLEHDRAKFSSSNDVQQDPDAKPTNSNANSIVIAENKVEQRKEKHIFFSSSIRIFRFSVRRSSS